MMYPFLQLEDGTEIVHSEMQSDGQVKVYIEKPVEGGFHSAVCVSSGGTTGKMSMVFLRQR